MLPPPGDELPDRERLIRDGIERFRRGDLPLYRPWPPDPPPAKVLRSLHGILLLAILLGGGGLAVWFYPEATVIIIVGAGAIIGLLAAPRKAIPWFLFLLGLGALLLFPMLGVILILAALAIKILLL